MARRPVSDERSVLGPAEKVSKVERFFVIELARYLRARPCDVRELLRSRRLLLSSPAGTGRPSVFWTSARGAAVVLAHFRAIQGAKYAKGEDPLRDADVDAEGARRRQALRRGLP